MTRRTGKKHIGALTITKRTLVTLLDVRLSINSEVHSFYVKSDWYPPVQPSVGAREGTGGGLIITRRDTNTESQNIGLSFSLRVVISLLPDRELLDRYWSY